MLGPRKIYHSFLFSLYAFLFLSIVIGLAYPIPNWIALYLHPVGPKFLLFTLFLLSLSLVIFHYFKNADRILISLPSFGNYSVAPFLCLAAAVFGTFPIFIYWGGYEVIDPNYAANYNIIAGHVPWSDAASFLTAAHNLLFDGELCSGCYRRPLNASFLAARLTVVGFDYNYALLLQAAIFGVACFLCASSVARTHGWAAGSATFAIVYAYGAYFLPTNMTETLGLILGAVAFAALWTGVNYDRFYIYTLGIWLFCLAQVARPGTLLVVASLLLIGLIKFKDKGLVFKLIVMLALAITPAFLTDKSLLYFYGDPSANSMAGNFSYLLYGITVGDKGWIQVFKDYPELYSMSFAAAESFIYNKIIENILSHPGVFLKGLFDTFEFGAVNFIPDFQRFILGGIGFKIFYLLLLLPIYVLLSSCFDRKYLDVNNYSLSSEGNNKIFFTLIFIGFFISLIFIYRDGGIRSISASVPFIASLLAIVFYPRHVYSLNGQPYNTSSAPVNWRSLHAWGPATMGGLIVIAALIVPRVGHEIVAPEPKIDFHCGPGEDKKVISLLAMAYAKVPAYKPNLSVHESNESIALWSKVALPATVFFAYDAVLQTSFFGYGALNLVDTREAYISVCTSKVGVGLWKVLSE